MTFSLYQILQLQDTTLYDYLRPVDLLQLTLTSKQCKDIILSQRSLVRHSYWKYYGPVLAMYRCKSHPYLQLKTANDYLLFLHKDLGYDKLLHLNSLNWCALYNEAPVEAWNKAIWSGFSVDDRYMPQEQCRVSEWRFFYEPDINYKSLNMEEPLAVSQLDFLIILFGLYTHNQEHYAKVDMRCLRYGYVHDALKKFGLQVLVLIFNLYYDMKFHGRINRPETVSIGLFESICQQFALGDGRQVLHRLANQMEAAPNFKVLLAHYRATRDLGLNDQLDLNAYYMDAVTRVVKRYSCASTALSDEIGGDLYSHYQGLEISDRLKAEMLRYLTYDWLCKLFQQYDFIPSIEFGWLMIELSSALDENQSLVVLQQKLADKINGGCIQEAAHLLIAITSSQFIRLDFMTQFDINLFQESKDAVTQVLMKLFDYIPRLQNDYFNGWLSIAFIAFGRTLVDEQQLAMLSRLIYAYSCALGQHNNDVGEVRDCNEIVRTIGALGDFDLFQQFIKSLNAKDVSQYNERMMGRVLHILRSRYSMEQVDKLFSTLLSLYREIDDPKKTALFINYHCQEGIQGDKLREMVKSLHSEEQLKQISMNLESDVIEDLKLGPECHSSWIKEIKQVASQLKFPHNMIKVMRIANDNCGSFANAPKCVQKELLSLIESTIFMPLEQRKSRFYFFDGLPYFVFKENLIIQKYIVSWKCVKVSLNRHQIPHESELAHGFLSYVHSDKVPVRDRRSIAINSENRECQDIILGQRLMVRNCYWKYYGPQLAMYRVKQHSYLQLKTSEDYKFFLCPNLNGTDVPAWNEAILQSLDDDLDEQDSDGGDYLFSKWSDYYKYGAKNIWLTFDEYLATSPMDELLITVCREFADGTLGSLDDESDDDNEDSTSKKTQSYRRFIQKHPYVWRFGYIHDALHKYGMHAMSRARILKKLCKHFALYYSCSLVEQFEAQFIADPNLRVLQAYYRVVQELGLYDQMDVCVHMKQAVLKIIEHYQSIAGCQKTVPEDNASDLYSSMILSEGLKLELRQNLSFEWGFQQFDQVAVVNSIRSAQLMVQLLIAFDVPNGLDYYSVKELKRAFKTEQLEQSKGTVVRVIYALLGTDEIVSNASQNGLSRVFELLYSLLLNQKKELFGKVILVFSRVYDEASQDDFYYTYPHQTELLKIVNLLGGAKELVQFIVNQNAQTLSQYNTSILPYLLYEFNQKIKEDLVNKMAVRLVSFDVIGRKLKKIHTPEQLKQICSYLDADCIDALQLDNQYQSTWIQEVHKVAEQSQFPENVIKIVQLAIENCGSLDKAPEFVESRLISILMGTVVDPPEDCTSRYYFFDGLPYFVMKEKLIIKYFIQVWGFGPFLKSDRQPPAESELALGFFDYVHSNDDDDDNKVPVHDRYEMVQTFAEVVSLMGSADLKASVVELASEHGYEVYVNQDDFLFG
ncbi:hypothetical protein MIR68_011512 [Amoeboaphelidium protococcarum]|nr:hypothetical protein MIR68_011512 [Amoeboaphelidium protococcarum]